MARQRTKGLAQPRRLSVSTNSLRIPFPEALTWDFETLWAVTENFIRMTIVQLGLPEVDSDVPLNLSALPDRLPGGFKKPNYFLLSLLAIAGSAEKRLKLSEIYEAIDRRYPDLEGKRPAYKRSLRHKLSLEPIFVNLKKTSAERDTISIDNIESRGNDWVINVRRINVPKRSQRREPRHSGSGSSSSSSQPIPPPPDSTTAYQLKTASHVASTYESPAYSTAEYNFSISPAVYEAEDPSGTAPHPTHMMMPVDAGSLQQRDYLQLNGPLAAGVSGSVSPTFHLIINNSYQNCTFFR